MMKRLTITLLALLFAVSLITGCSKVEDTTLEGTWRITESTIGGLKVTYPMDIEFTGITMTIQPYIQLKNNVYAEITKQPLTPRFPGILPRGHIRLTETRLLLL